MMSSDPAADGNTDRYVQKIDNNNNLNRKQITCEYFHHAFIRDLSLDVSASTLRRRTESIYKQTPA